MKEHNIEVVLVNPHLVKKNKENRDNTQSKSDVKDALVIADMIKNGYYAFTRSNPEIYEKLRIFMSNRDVIIKRLVTTKNQLHRWLEMVFPELQQVFNDITCKGAIATLRLFPTRRNIYIKTGRHRYEMEINYETACRIIKTHFLIEVAKRTVGTKLALDAHKLHLSNY
ncbi:transposase [Bacillus sp. CGMCC 1.16607]|uniref:IS110 family transposase n=1 Tax=Bacillus sp. CGMCC 1.16607 TaxID=3351842 RepID=UPI0036406AB3